MSAAEAPAWHDSEMQEINFNALQVHESDASRPCKNGGEWTSETERWLIPHVSVEVAGGGCRRCCVTRRIMRNRSLRFLDDSWVKRFLRRRVDCVREQTRVLWPSTVMCTCLKESRAQRSHMRLLGRMVFLSRSSWHSLRRGSFFFRAACWTLASGMRLANHVKFQCGESRKFDWCCEIPSDTGAPCGTVISCGAC